MLSFRVTCFWQGFLFFASSSLRGLFLYLSFLPGPGVLLVDRFLVMFMVGGLHFGFSFCFFLVFLFVGLRSCAVF